MIRAATFDPSPADTLAENARLRAEVATLRAKIAELETLANTDPLVLLGNRRAFERAVTRAISALTGAGAVPAVLFIDLDGLKTVNDRYGHNAGDMMLRHVAAILSAADRTAFVARIGGDEFGMIIRATDLGDARAQADRIAVAVARQPVMLADASGARVSIDCAITIGVALITSGDTCASVIARADAAMYAQRSAR